MVISSPSVQSPPPSSSGSRTAGCARVFTASFSVISWNQSGVLLVPIFAGLKHTHMKIIHSLFCFAAFLAPPLAYSQAPAETVKPQPAFEQKLREVRYDLRLEDGRFVGGAAPVLESAIADAQYVLIGEDHITREIPQFTTAVCDVMGPQGLSAMAVEVGPQAAEFVSALFGSPDRLARTGALLHQYPEQRCFHGRPPGK